jgi:hypothetical protein
VEDMFTPRRLHSLPELRTIFRDIVQHPSLRLSEESFDKVRAAGAPSGCGADPPACEELH